MTRARLRTGQIAEDLTAARLAAAGWWILARNARTRQGEIDIVARDRRTLVFVEVKGMRAGTARGPERPILAIGPRKQLRVRRLATAWMAAHRDLPHYEAIRFDAIGVTLDGADALVHFEHIEGAF
ncbi:MAG: YraN family protein [Solirubrobacterales bacterium]